MSGEAFCSFVNGAANRYLPPPLRGRHDWGSQICYEAARMRPDVFRAVVGIAVPVRAPSGPFLRSSH